MGCDGRAITTIAPTYYSSNKTRNIYTDYLR